jgi:hypothetical protein
MLEEDFDYQLKENHRYFKNPKFHWSLGYCQGDGLSFSCDIDVSEFLKAYYPNMKISIYDAICNIIYTFQSHGNCGRYYFASKNDIDFELEYYDKEYKGIENLCYEILEHVRQVYMTVCKEFEKQGYSAYEYLYSEEYARETSTANEMQFLKDGTIF